MTERPIYLDHNASTPMEPEVWAAMAPYSVGVVGNASSTHWSGRSSRQAILKSREQIAAALDCDPGEVFFTAGATEANNLALFGLPAGKRLAISAVEHPSLMEPAERCAKSGCIVDWIPPNSEGIVEVIDRFDDPNLVMSACQLANSETGAIHPVEALARRSAGKRFHCDAVQAVGKIPVSFRRLGVTSLTLSGHKIGGPAGVGAILIAKGSPLPPMIVGGHQQAGVRAGTEPVALSVGLAAAVGRAAAMQSEWACCMAKLRDAFERRVAADIPGVWINGPKDSSQRLANTSNISFPHTPAAAMVIALDLEGIACTAGSACSSGSMTPSHVLAAMGFSGDRLRNAVRFSFGRSNTLEEVERAADAVLRVHGRAKAGFSA